MRARYRDNMTEAETAALMAECAELDTALATAAAADTAQAELDAQHPEEAEAAAEQSLDYFNRYIAGDR